MDALRQIAQIIPALPDWLLERFTAWAERVSGGQQQ